MQVLEPVRLLSSVAAERHCSHREPGQGQHCGSYVPLKHYRSDARVSSVMLEIRRDVYMDESTVTRTPTGFASLQGSLQRLVDQVRQR